MAPIFVKALMPHFSPARQAQPEHDSSVQGLMTLRKWILPWERRSDAPLDLGIWVLRQPMEPKNGLKETNQLCISQLSHPRMFWKSTGISATNMTFGNGFEEPPAQPPPVVRTWGDWLAMVAASPLIMDVPHITKFTLHGRLYTCWCYLWATNNPLFTAITSHYRTLLTIH